MRSLRLRTWAIVLIVLLAGAWVAQPYARALSLIVRAADMGGALEAFASHRARAVSVEPATTVPTRHGTVAARVYRPAGRFTRTVLLVPGIHAMGIDEPRLTGLAADLAGSGYGVVTIALPDLTRYFVTPQSTDQIEDALAWIAGQRELAPDGRVGLLGISFAGGLAIVAAGRPAIRDRTAFVVSFGGHADLPRVIHYLCTGEAPHAEGVELRPPHDYGVAVVLHAMAPLVVPPDQAEPLREGIRTFLWASQLTLVDTRQADAAFARARAVAAALPEPASTYLGYLNDRDVAKLGPILTPHIGQQMSDEAISPERAPTPPAAPVYLLHGADDTVIPPVESVLLGRALEARHARVRVLLSRLITHAEVDRSAAPTEAWKLVSFWASVLRQ